MTSFSGRFYPHYYIAWLPLIALVVSTSISAVDSLLRSRVTRQSVYSIVMSLFLSVLIINAVTHFLYVNSRTNVNQKGEFYEGEIVDYIGEMDEEYLLVWGQNLFTISFQINQRRRVLCTFIR